MNTTTHAIGKENILLFGKVVPLKVSKLPPLSVFATQLIILLLSAASGFFVLQNGYLIFGAGMLVIIYFLSVWLITDIFMGVRNKIIGKYEKAILEKYAGRALDAIFLPAHHAYFIAESTKYKSAFLFDNAKREFILVKLGDIKIPATGAFVTNGSTDVATLRRVTELEKGHAYRPQPTMSNDTTKVLFDIGVGDYVAISVPPEKKVTTVSTLNSIPAADDFLVRDDGLFVKIQPS